MNSLAIAKRLKRVLKTIKSKMQTGFLSGRLIGESTCLISDILHMTEEKQIPRVLMLIDFEKAFDSVPRDFFYAVLKFFNFGDGFLKWITIFNKNIKAYVNLSGYLSDPIDIERGCQQDDPIAPYLFIIHAQILCLSVIHNESIRGITFNNADIKLSQYADNTTLVLDGSKRSLMAALNTLETAISSLLVNTDKTQLGSGTNDTRKKN